eukprot:2685067-Pyramimonas_sp.AAC.1
MSYHIMCTASARSLKTAQGHRATDELASPAASFARKPAPRPLSAARRIPPTECAREQASRRVARGAGAAASLARF